MMSGVKIALLAMMGAAAMTSALDEVIASGRCAAIGETPDARVSEQKIVAPGPAPLFSFRLYEGQSQQRFANSDLMLDDAGH